MDIKISEKLIYVGDMQEPKAYINYNLKDNVMYITHTIVGKQLQGKGVAGKLTEKAIEFAREKDYKIKPVCPYTVSYFKKRPELEDILY